MTMLLISKDVLLHVDETVQLEWEPLQEIVVACLANWIIGESS
jgi:hypothetical protein